MPDIRCSHCGKDNPDFLDVCQFCQSPLKSESMLHIGEKPTKKNTGELEGILPEWLKDARKQARDSAEEEAAHVAAQANIQKEGPLDLLAGLSFQSESADQQDVPDWLQNINAAAKSKPSTPVAPAQPETDFFAQFNKSETKPQSEPTQDNPPSPSNEPMQPSQSNVERDELSAWFSQASEQTSEPFAAGDETAQPHSDWGLSDQVSLPGDQTPAPKEAEDLSWLHDLEATAKGTDELKIPQQNPNRETGFSSTSQAAGQDDLSWLNNLGAIPAPEQPASLPSQSQEDLSWLDNLGGVSKPIPSASSEEDLGWLNSLGATPAQQPPSQTSVPQEDLGWLNAFKETAESRQPAPVQPSSSVDPSLLNNLGATPAEQAAPHTSESQDDLGWLNAFKETAESSQSESSQPSSSDDMSWLNTLGALPAEQPASQPSQSQDDLSWLSNLQSGADTLSSAPFADQTNEESGQTETPHISPFTPRRTAPLNEEENTSIPDWLKSATEGPSMPMGTGELDQFREDFKIPTQPEEAFSWKSFTQEAKPAEEQPPRSKPEPASVDPNLFAPAGGSSVPSADDVNSLFSMEMPDWMSQAEPAREENVAQDIGIHAEGGEALAPVDLPSWVQAMRPVEAVVSNLSPSIDDQPTEREGPLAGFKGLIPAVPVGSARRPKPISLKLQASDEQQTAAAILEQLLVGETSPRPLVSTPVFFSQRVLRWVLAGFFILVLGAVIGLHTEMMQVSPDLPPAVDAVSSSVEVIPENSAVLVVVDYEPSLSGELEAAAGPLLNHIALLRHPGFSFIATSPNGSGLVEKLLSNTNISKAAPTGLGYLVGQDYYNLGYLPGGESGVLSFVLAPRTTMPALGDKVPDVFSGYSAVILLTDHADSARVWIEQLQPVKQANPAIANQPLLVVSSAQAGPLLQPYVLSRQITGLISGVPDAARYEHKNNVPPGIARSYWDAFGVGIIMAVALIVLGSLWSIFAGLRARNAETAQG